MSLTDSRSGVECRHPTGSPGHTHPRRAPGKPPRHHVTIPCCEGFSALPPQPPVSIVRIPEGEPVLTASDVSRSVERAFAFSDDDGATKSTLPADRFDNAMPKQTANAWMPHRTPRESCRVPFAPGSAWSRVRVRSKRRIASFAASATSPRR